MRLARPSLVLLVALATGCPSRKVETEADIRAREAARIDARLAAWKPSLYRVAKTALRALPPRDVVRGLAGDRKELTREEWAALIEKEPALAAHKDRVGFFVVGAQLREAAFATAVVGAAVLAAKGGGRLAGDVELWQLPRTPSPFGSASVFYRECKDLLADDEDRHPTLCASMMPSSLHEAARGRSGIFAKPPFDRVVVPAFEHLVLGCAWIAVEPDLALYELGRARTEDLLALEEIVVRGGRAGLFTRSGWHYHALDELAAIEKRLPDASSSAARLAGGSATPRDVEAILSGLLHVLRAECYSSLRRNEDASRELELARKSLEGQERLRAGAHALAARVFFDQGNYKDAARELRLAADALPKGKEQDEARALADRIAKELPDSTAAVDLVRFAGRVVSDEVAKLVVSDDLARWARSFRETAGEQVGAWEKAFPSTDDLREKGKDLWAKLRGVAGTAAAGTAATGTASATR